MVVLNKALNTATLLVGLFDESIFDATNPSHCLSKSYHGRFGKYAVYLPTQDCGATATAAVNDMSIQPLADIRPMEEEYSLFWIEQAQVEDSLQEEEEEANFMKQTQTYTHRLFTQSCNTEDAGFYQGDGQAPLSRDSCQHAVSAIVRDYTKSDSMVVDAALLYIPPKQAARLMENTPRFWRLMSVPLQPQAYIPVPKPAVELIRSIAHNMSFDPVVDALVSSLNIKTMKADIAYLTGEASTSSITSRHSFATGARDAAEWLKAQFEQLGATCTLQSFLPGFSPNVICSYAGTRAAQGHNGTAILSAHYDSRGSFGSLRAPGGDDDGSGTTALLAIARSIYKHGVTFASPVQLCLFAGEEQGLLGSKAHARSLRQQNANVTVNIQADMLAYRAPGEPMQLGLPDLIGTKEVAALVSKAAALYSPELSVGFTPA